MAHLAGYRLAGGNIHDLTFNQELFVSMVAVEMVKTQAKLAGADVKEKPSKKCLRKKREKDDQYGEALEFRKRMKEAAKLYEDIELTGCTKPL